MRGVCWLDASNRQSDAQLDQHDILPVRGRFIITVCPCLAALAIKLHVELVHLSCGRKTVSVRTVWKPKPGHDNMHIATPTRGSNQYAFTCSRMRCVHSLSMIVVYRWHRDEAETKGNNRRKNHWATECVITAWILITKLCLFIQSKSILIILPVIWFCSFSSYAIAFISQLCFTFLWLGWGPAEWTRRGIIFPVIRLSVQNSPRAKQRSHAFARQC